MQILLRIVVLVTLTLLGWLLFPVMFNVMVAAGLTPVANEEQITTFGEDITTMAVYVWLASIIPGIISIFIQKKWRYVLLLCPVLAPSIFAILYTLTY